MATINVGSFYTNRLVWHADHTGRSDAQPERKLENENGFFIKKLQQHYI